MVHWNWCGRACVIALSLSALVELVADEVPAPQSKAAAPQPKVATPPAANKAQDAAPRSAIENILRVQQDAWNRGDIDAFMEHYWKNDDLTFSSSGKTTRGWRATLAHYREHYPTREKMGRVTLSGLEITPLGDAAAFVLGRWKVDRQTEPVGGNFTLVFRKIDGRWLIVHDHTSRLAE
jgi:uncharacterized protein (TIGR02246 family)